MIGITRPTTVCCIRPPLFASVRSPTVQRHATSLQLLVVVDNLLHAPDGSRAARTHRFGALRTKSPDGADALRCRGRRNALPRGRRADLEDLPGDGETGEPGARA